MICYNKRDKERADTLKKRYEELKNKEDTSGDDFMKYINVFLEYEKTGTYLSERETEEYGMLKQGAFE